MATDDAPVPSERLDSWKEIAAYLKRDESTVRRWESEGLPVHRLAHKKKASVYAYRSEIDGWWQSGSRPLLEKVEKPIAGERRTGVALALASLALFVILIVWSLVRLREDVPTVSYTHLTLPTICSV